MGRQASSSPWRPSWGSLTHEEFHELAWLTPTAREELKGELADAITRLRGLLAEGDPFYILAVMQDLNLVVPGGEYHEPTHEGLESRVELAAGFLATQPLSAPGVRPTANHVQATLDEIDHVLEVVLPHNLSASPMGDADLARLRFSSAMRWMWARGSSFPGHSPDLAREVHGVQDSWMLATWGSRSMT